MVLYEIKKLSFHKLFWWVLFVLFLLNLILNYCVFVSPLNADTSVTRSDIAAVYREYTGCSVSEMLRAMEADQGNIDGDVYDFIYESLSEKASYGQYLEEIQEEKDRLSGSLVFSNQDSFSGRNIDKIARRYQRIEPVEIQASHSFDIESVAGADVTTILLLLAVVLCVLQIVLTEEECGTISLIKPMKNGRRQTITAKLFAIALFLAFFVVIFYLTNFLVSCRLFGMGDMSRPIQCLDGYLSSVYQISVFQYLILFLLFQYVSLLALGMLLAFVCLAVKNNMLASLAIALILGFELWLYEGIDMHSYVSFARNFNIAAALNTASFFETYQTMNFFGFPVWIGTAAFITVSLILVVSGILTVRTWTKNDIGYRKLSGIRLFHRTKKRKISHRGLFTYECKKMFAHQRVIAVLLIFIGVQCVSYFSNSLQKDEVQYYYEFYASQLEGDLNAQKEEALEQWKTEIEDQESLINEYALQVEEGQISASYAEYMTGQLDMPEIQKVAFQRAYTQYQWLMQQQEKGKKVSFISDLSYQELFASEEKDLWDCVKLFLALILGLVFVFPYEERSGMEIIIHTAHHGAAKVFHRKVILSVLYVTVCWAIVFLPRIVSIGRVYTLPHLNWSSASLSYFAYMPDWVTIKMTIVFMQIIRVLACTGIAAAIQWFSTKVKSVSIVIVGAMIALLFPVMLCLLGVTNHEGLLAFVTGQWMIR